MIGAWARKWFFPGFARRRTADGATAAAETTGGGDEPVAWVCVAAGLQPLDAEVLKSRLESESITAMVRQESIGAVMGLTVGGLGSATVWVPDEFADQASEILDLP